MSGHLGFHRKRIVGTTFVLGAAGAIVAAGALQLRILALVPTAADDALATVATRSRQAAPPPRPVAHSIDGRGETSLPTELIHDFGVVPPDTKHTWRFPIANTTAAPWTIDKLGTTCLCTVASVSAPIIAPGAEEYVEVEFKAPAKVADVRKSVTVGFAESHVPPMSLTISAAIRAPMTPSRPDVTFSMTARDKPQTTTVQLFNHSKSLWKTIDVRSSPEWLEARVAVVVDSVSQDAPPMQPTPDSTGTRNARGDATQAESSDDRTPREVWQLQLATRADKLGPGYHAADVELVADTADAVKLVVSIHLTAPVRLAPEKLVFAPRSGESCVRAARIIFSTSVAPSVSDGMTASCEDKAVSLALHRVSEWIWELRATLARSDRDTGPEGGGIQIEFADATKLNLTLPYSVLATSNAE